MSSALGVPPTLARLLACLVLFWGASVQAEITPDLLQRPIVQLQLAGEGALMVKPTDVGIAAGDPLTRSLIRAAIRRLWASGRWSDVQIDAFALQAGARLVVYLRPRTMLRRIRFIGNRVADERTLTRAMQVSEGSQTTRESLPELRGLLQRAYRDIGYLNAQVELELRETDEPAQKVLLVHIYEAEPTRVRTIVVQGDPLPTGLSTKRLVGLSPGDVLDLGRLRQGLRSGQGELRARGFLEAVLSDPEIDVTAGAADMRLEVAVGPRYEIEFAGVKPLRRSQVRAALALQKERLTAAAVSGMVERVTELYRRHGFADAAVRITRRLHAIEEDEPAEQTATLLLNVDAGPQVEIVAIRFPGARRFSRQFLRDQILSYLEEELPGPGLLHPVDSEVVDALGFETGRRPPREVMAPLVLRPAGTYYEPSVREAIEHLLELYQADGYLWARIGPPGIARLDAQRAALAIPVVEGPRARVFKLTLSGNRVISSRELLAASELTRGAPFSYLKLEEARLRILQAYREQGYLYAAVNASPRFSGDRTRAEVVMQIEEGFPVRIKRVDVVGLVRTSRALVLDMLELREGELYRPSRARASEERMAELGVFSGVTIQPEDPETAERDKTLVVRVTERRSQFLDFSAGASTGQGARSGFEYGYRNLLGQAVGLSLRVQFAYQFFFQQDTLEQRFDDLTLAERLERRATLGITIPRIRGLPGVRTTVDFVHLRDNERDFGFDKNGVTLTFTYRLLRGLTLALSEDLEENNIGLFVNESLAAYLALPTIRQDQRLRELLRVPDGRSTLLGTRLTLTYDRRDSAFVPTKGLYVSLASEWARTLRAERMSEGLLDTGGAAGSQFVSHFMKMALTTSSYAPLGQDIVLASQLRLGGILHLKAGSETYPNRAFFLGGVDTMRGFFQDALVPQDTADGILDNPMAGVDANAVVRSGDAFVLFRSELRFPIIGRLQAGVFTDIGNLWSDPDRILHRFKLRYTAGLGLRLATPVGPLALDWGMVVNRRPQFDGPAAGVVHFSIGVF
ncbi:MAG: BamA/TamA family outer membrane protein [Proteobacteria bacterium]|nr:BamA/TamA family outer membrane protein [Pseudomonadota bacterium]